MPHGGKASPLILVNSSCATVVPMAAGPCATTVTGGVSSSASADSSKPMSAYRGTRPARPAAEGARMDRNRPITADQAWLGGLISRRVPLSEWPRALAGQPGDVKVAMDLTK